MLLLLLHTVGEKATPLLSKPEAHSESERRLPSTKKVLGAKNRKVKPQKTLVSGTALSFLSVPN